MLKALTDKQHIKTARAYNQIENLGYMPVSVKALANDSYFESLI